MTGLTLLEVLLTLSLGVVIAGLIGGAMRTYGLEMGVRDLEMRRTQLATQLFAMIERDLISTVRQRPIDNAPLEAFFLATLGGEQADVNPEDDLTSAGLDSTFEDASLDAQTPLVESSTVTSLLQQPGLIGSEDVLQIDISRLPRIEEYSPLIGDPTMITDIPSDLKTIVYAVQPAGFIGGATDPMETLSISSSTTNRGSGGGLVRRSIDRTMTIQAANSGGLSRLNASGQIVAPEVVQLEFRYFDGIQWINFWNSDESRSLPHAVEVLMTMRPVDDPVSEDLVTYRHLIRLPMGGVVESEQEQEQEQELEQELESGSEAGSGSVDQGESPDSQPEEGNRNAGR